MADLRALLGAGLAERFPAALYPPEFGYSPFDGQALQRAPVPSGPCWVPPFGAPDLSARATLTTRGLRQCAQPLRLASPVGRGARDDPDRELPLPPHGRWESLAPPRGAP